MQRGDRAGNSCVLVIRARGHTRPDRAAPATKKFGRLAHARDFGASRKKSCCARNRPLNLEVKVFFFKRGRLKERLEP